MHTDIMGIPISVGDVVTYPAAGYAGSVPPLHLGEVVGLTKAGVKVIQLNKDFSRVQVADGYQTGSGQFYTRWNGTQVETQKFVKTGERDKSPENIKFFDHRFYIVRKI